MAGFEGTLARKLDFGELPGAVTSTGGRGRAALRLTPSRRLTGPDKYDVLERRRRHAQINARHLLALMDTDK
jgi:hypothetical protein